MAEAWIATNKSELVQHRLQSYEHLEHETLAPETSRPALDEGAPAGLGTIMETNQPSLH